MARGRDNRESLRHEVLRIGGDIISSDRFAAAASVPHHRGGRTLADHSFETAVYALRISRWFMRRGVKVSEVDAVRASLLHDIGMTEARVFKSPSRKKARSHPKVGSRIAREEFGANDTQTEAILHHMWPIGTSRPHGAVGWVVTAADKCCSVDEVRRDTTGAARPDLPDLPNPVPDEAGPRE